MAFNFNPVVRMKRSPPTHVCYYLYSYQRFLHKGWRHKTPLKQARNIMTTAHTIGVRAQFDAELVEGPVTKLVVRQAHHERGGGHVKVMAVASHFILT